MEKFELAVTEIVVEQPGEDLSTILGVDNACMGRRLPCGSLLWWIIAAAACVPIGATTVLPTATKSVAFHLRRIDEAIPRTAVSPTFSIKQVFHSATPGSGECQWEHADARSDEHQYRIPAIFMRAGAWRIFNCRRTMTPVLLCPRNKK